jgi:hypothetical protein
VIVRSGTLAWLVVIASGLICATPAVASDIHRANVKRFLLRDPQVSPRVKATIRYGHGGGLDRLVYGDLTGDGQADVVVPVFSGGTAGDIAFFVLSEQGGALHAIKRSNQEYKIGVRIVRGQLQVTRPYYRSSDPNCCPDYLEVTTYRFDGKRLVAASRARRSGGSSP